jgi:hypothetical protein
MHLSNLLEPWILLRLAAGLVPLALFGRAARTSIRILHRFDVVRSSEGQLALERQADLSSMLTRVGCLVQVGLLALSMLAGDRLSEEIRGAMCGYGVFHANEWGFRSLAATVFTAIAAGIVSELYALDARARGFDLVRPLAIAALILAPLAAIDFGLASAFAMNLDLSVVASCCSVRLDQVTAVVAPVGSSAEGRAIAAVGATLGIALAIVLAAIAARRPRSSLLVASGAASLLVAFPFALLASVLVVAPAALELPQHACPFCLLRPSAFGIGYPLFGATLLALIWSLGAGIGAMLSTTASSRAALVSFAPARLRREAFAWAAVFVLGVLPVARYALVGLGPWPGGPG